MKLIKTVKEFYAIAEVYGKNVCTREEIREIARSYELEGIKYSLFSECYECGWYLEEGIRWANTTDFWIIKGEYKLEDGYLE